MTTTREAYLAARDRLRRAGIDDAHFEAELLMRHALGLGADRASLLTRLAEPQPVEQAALEAFEALLARRLKHEPSAYILGKREFYHLDLEVTPAVLIPRPETETVVEVAIRRARGLRSHEELTIADVGTGSGAIALALARALPNATVVATDVSKDALDVAQRNAARHALDKRIQFIEGDLLAPVTARLDLLVANLPYVTTSDLAAAQPEVRDYEPSLALDGGPDGLDVIRRLLAEAGKHLGPSALMVLEIGASQDAAARQAAAEAFPNAHAEVVHDLAGRPRVLVIQM